MEPTFFYVLEKAGLIKDRLPNTDEIGRLSTSRLQDIVDESVSVSTIEHIAPADSLFAHSASISLGGGPDPCAGIDCRLRRARQLAQFALLYSDRVYIRHPFFIRHDDDERTYRRQLTNELHILGTFRPLIERGLIVPFTPSLEYCAHCLAASALGEGGDKRIETLSESLRAEFFEEFELWLESSGSDYRVEIRGPEELIEHGSAWRRYANLPPALSSAAEECSQKGVSIKLSRSMRSALGVHEQFAKKSVENLAFELTAAQSFKTSYLTDLPFDLRILNRLRKNAEHAQRSFFLQKHLSTVVPFLEDVPFDDLVSLREHEGDAFIAFRKALGDAIEEFRRQGKAFDEGTAKELYADVVRPALSKLNMRVDAAKSAILRRAANSALGWAGAISIGTYAGIVPHNLVNAAATLGFTKVAADLLATLAERFTPETEIAQESMYFLWQVERRRDDSVP